MKRRVLALLGCVCLTLGGCHYEQPGEPSPSPSPSPTVAPAVEQTFALPVDPVGGWSPYEGSKSGNMTLLPLICESLFVLDNTFTPQPLLATGGTVSDDGLSWTVRLRSGARFSNGEPLTAQVVADAANAARGQKSAYATRLSGVKKVSAQEDGTVLFQLAAPNAGFLGLLDFPIALVTEAGVFGTGPYTLNGNKLSARSDWWRGLELPLETIALEEMGDAGSLMAAFNAGTVSVVAADPTGADTLGYSGSYQDWEYPTSTMLYLGFRCNKGPCKSPEFRRAVSQALDRNALVSQALSGHALAAALPAPPTALRYDKTLAEGVGYDSLAAQTALEELGYELGEDGLRYSGRSPLAVTLLINADNVYKEALAQAVADALGALGVQVNVRALPWEEYKKALGQGDFDLYLAESRMTGDLDPGPLLTAGSGLCYGGFSSRALTETLARARQTGEWRGFYEQWTEDMPLAVLCFKTAGLLTRWGQVEGATPTQGNLFYQFERWNIVG